MVPYYFEKEPWKTFKSYSGIGILLAFGSWAKILDRSTKAALKLPVSLEGY